LVAVKKEQESIKSVDLGDPRFDPYAKSNQEIDLNFIEFERNYDFESLFILGNVTQ
jgi:hypothetical protein